MPTVRVQKAASEQARNPMDELARLGQSIWLDSIDRSLILSGELRSMISRGLRGLTSNPAIFEKAITQTSHYDHQIRSLLLRRDYDAKELFDTLAIRDTQDAADLFSEVFARTGGVDGMVSLEVAPFLAHDAEGTVEEARRLWRKVGRPNLMIKVPGTPEGLIAFEKLIAEGINVNVTLLFSREVYRQFAMGYIRALAKRRQQSLSIDAIRSVASFFVSRIDTEVDKRIDRALERTLDRRRRGTLEQLRGKLAIANAKCAYRIFRELSLTPEWKALREAGAHPQRLLWASTSTKNPKYRDVLYVEELIGPETVNTVPFKTLLGLEDHARIQVTLDQNVEEAQQILSRLESTGISLQDVTDTLLSDGIRLFSEPDQRLMTTLETRRRKLMKPPLNSIELRLPILLETEIGHSLQKWKQENRARRLWQHDPSIWTQSGEELWLGWLDIPDRQSWRLNELISFQKEIATHGFRDAVVLGMGGSSLCADVLGSIYEPQDSFPDLHILDSTHPERIHALESLLDLNRTLFIVSSKSGTTLEPNLFFEYFYEKLRKAVGEEKAASRFIAVTDPGSALEQLAKRIGFWKIFHGVPSIGGRYSALSDFGMLPAAVMGMNLPDLLRRATEMAHACGPEIQVEDNPGLLLGVVLGTLGLHGRDKVTIFSSPELWDMGSWLEQLLAESTGKLGKGLLPVTDEKPGPPSAYGPDRQFVYLKLNGTMDQDLDTKVNALAAADFPVVEIEVCDCSSIIQEFYRWEFATAVAGSVLEINPFDQPDVEASKIEARRVTSEVENTGSLPAEKPFFAQDGVELYADPRNAEQLKRLAGEAPSLAKYLRAHFDRLKPGDYLALLAYLPMTFDNEEVLRELRLRVRDLFCCATCVGFGPRYLHSTGQIYKGGPNTGVFVEITAEPTLELPIPGKPYGFATVNAAQARGDFEVLSRRARRLLRIHFTTQAAGRFNGLAREAFS